ncbi:hypothetical protein RvY_10790 [Ramazzottius varieornatus]|uniref:Uncharacterized protein n=1 Tax=Ramazzottius varieornatus TaxID=947166 RepID=A0A1D1VFZ7_RAMVA|nr:hypothetical protein RvY_10790 [Ramazzottius varieornatus]
MDRLKMCFTAAFVYLLSYLAMSAGQAINPMMYGMGMYMNPYYTGFYGGFGNMGHMNPLGYQISTGMAVPGMGGGMGGGGFGGGGFGFGAGSLVSPSSFLIASVVALIAVIQL